jgi:hypothetical protein
MGGFYTSYTVKEKKMKKFIKTNDLKTKEILLELGYQLISDANGVATFLNDSKIVFDKKDKKVIYSNKLEI